MILGPGPQKYSHQLQDSEIPFPPQVGPHLGPQTGKPIVQVHEDVNQRVQHTHEEGCREEMQEENKRVGCHWALFPSHPPEFQNAHQQIRRKSSRILHYQGSGPVCLVALWWKVLCVSSSLWRRKGLGSPSNKGPEMGIETGLDAHQEEKVAGACPQPGTYLP